MSREGRLEVCSNYKWSGVCNDGWDNINAEVACFQLGHSSVGELFVSCWIQCTLKIDVNICRCYDYSRNFFCKLVH